MVHNFKESPVSEKTYLLNMVSDINVNCESYRKTVIKEIKSSRLSPSDKKRFLMTASAIKANSFEWKQSWDKGCLY